MTICEGFSRTRAAPPTAISLISAIKSFALRIMLWLDVRADRSAAAALHGQLSRLSDAELAKRGLSRDTLAGIFSRPGEKE